MTSRDRERENSEKKTKETYDLYLFTQYCYFFATQNDVDCCSFLKNTEIILF